MPNFCPETLAASITALAIYIAKDKTADELDVLNSVFMQLGDTLGTISAQRAILESNRCNKQSN